MRPWWVVLLCTVACGAPADEGDDTGAATLDAAARNGEQVTDPDATPFTSFEAAGVPPWSAARERGIGVVHLDPGPGFSGQVADTVVVRVEPRSDAPVVARLFADTTLVYRFEVSPGVLDAPGALEFGYEEVGLPVVALASGGWSRVHLGTSSGEPVTGWAPPRPGAVGRTLWEELLPGMPLFFLVPADSVRLHEAPEGPVVAFPLPPADVNGLPGDYIFWPLERAGDWMRVRAVTPSDYCADPPTPREDTLWIRWRGDAGRPRVWYFTRGC